MIGWRVRGRTEDKGTPASAPYEPLERPPDCASVEREEHTSRRWLALTGLTAVTFLLLLDDTAVAVAQPAIQRQLGLNLEGLQWLVNVYTLTIAAFILLAGQLADRFGRRRMYLTGLAIFTLASLGAGLASSGASLIVMRAVQGFGAALVTPTALAIIADVFPRSQRATALGIWAGLSASALGLGPLVGAVINDSLGWRWIFLINAPVGVGVWLLARAVLRDDHAPRPSLRLDALGAVISGAGLLALVLRLTQANGAGWLSVRSIALFLGAGLCLALFIRHERLTAEPLLQLSLFKDRAFAGANIQILLATSVMCSLFFFLALYLQTVLSYSALEAGTGLLPLTITIVVVGPYAGRLADRIGPRIPVALGMLLLAGALLGLSGLRMDSSIGSLVPWLTLAGFAIGLVTAPTTATAMGSTDADGHGSAAAVFSTFQTTGLTLGIAIMGAILASFGPGAAFARTISDEHHAAFVRGFSTALTVNAVIALIAAGIALTMLRPTAGRTERPNGAAKEEPDRRP
ncbi:MULTISPECIES: MFS transporter [Nocardioides]|uniref:MFS transporter n=1 Tax=Nocardioides TaxID=1839 RepID=UPI000689196B|nr:MULTISPECIES: MFS transporter [Nocardioides]